jgi:hypothetical protein
MSKKFRKFSDFEYDEDYNEDRSFRNELQERRKMKRMRTALKTRNIEELLDPDDY